jgi:hypothetical protein
MARQFACEDFTTPNDVIQFGCECDLDGVDLDELIGQASDFLHLATGGKVSGRCSTTVRPCSPSQACGGSGCECCSIEGIPLLGPDPTITAVKIDGAIVPASEYVLMDGLTLVRVGGSWPGCKDPLLPDTEDNTFSISYTYGLQVPFVGRMAANELVCEMAKAYNGMGSMLPTSAVSTTIGGVSVDLRRLNDRLRTDETVEAIGLVWTSRFLAVYSPNGGVGATVWSPEIGDGWSLHVRG